MLELILQNRYRVLRLLADGGFGETFIAEDTQMPSKRVCLLKSLKPVNDNPMIHDLVKERFEREAAILERLGETNPQIPKLYAYFEENNRFYLVEEFIEGDTLSKKVRDRGVFSDSQVRDILISLLKVLDFVHGQKIIHRDIKPDNIILRHGDNMPVLIDFGAVKETMGTVFSNSGHSHKSIIIGTAGYMPSEQGIGRPVYSSDLYALGLTAIFLLTGKTPETIPNDPLTGKFLWREGALDTSLSLGKVIDKSIAPNANDRYPTARDMLNALLAPDVPVATVVDSATTVIQDCTANPTIAVVPSLVTTIGPKNENPKREFPEWMKAAITGGIMGSCVLGGIILNDYLSKRNNPESAVTPSPEMVSDGGTDNSRDLTSRPPVSNLSDFPKPVCGEASISGRFYQVAINDTTSLDRVKSDFCQDAFIKENNVQVAAFEDFNKAQELQQQLTPHFNGVFIKETALEPATAPVAATASAPNYTSSNSETLSRSEAVSVVENWLQAKRKIFGPDHNLALGEQYLTGKAFHDNISRSDGKESSGEWLLNNNSYYIYGVQRVDSVENINSYGDNAVIDVVVTEQRTLYNSNGGIDPNNSALTTLLVRYNLVNEGGRWKIADYKSLRTLSRR